MSVEDQRPAPKARRLQAATAAAIFGFVCGLIVVRPQATSAVSGAQVSPQVPVFRADAGYVQMSVIVSDGRGNFVTGLTRDDFEVLEDGKPQTLDAFSFVKAGPADDPTHEAWISGLTAADAVAVGRRRCYLIVLDHFHLTWNQSPRLHSAVREFIERHLRVEDLASIVHLSSSPKASVFTSNKRVLLEFAGVAPSSALRNAKGDLPAESHAIDRDVASGIDALAAGSTADAAQRSFDGLGRLLEYFAEVQSGRKTVLLFSQGVSIDPLGAAAGGTPRVRETVDRANEAMRQLLVRAQKGEVTIYTIDPRGLAAVDPFAGAEDVTRLNEWGSLRTIATHTGGEAIVGYTRFDVPFRRIVEDSSQYYVLGYYTNNSGKDRDFHRLRVRVKGRSYEVRTRLGFYGDGLRGAPANSNLRGKTTRELLSHPLPIGDQGLPFQASASVVGRTGDYAEVQLILELDGRGLARGGDGQTLPNNQVEIGYQAFDVNGRSLPANVTRVDFQATDNSWSAISLHGWRYLTTLRLPLGFHQLHVAVREARGGRFGSVFLDMDVADLCRGEWKLGSIVLGTSNASAVPTSGRQSRFLSGLAGSPVARRDFARSETVTAHVSVCSDPGASLGPIAISTNLQTQKGAVIMRNQKNYAASDLVDGSIRHLQVLPLSDLPAGRLLLTVEAARGTSPSAVQQRQIVLTLR